MHALNDVLEVFAPLLDDAHARFAKRDKPTTEYARTVFVPLIEAAGRAAGADASPAIEHLMGMEPSCIKAADVHEAVRKLLAPAAEVSAIDLEQARARTAEVAASVARVPLTERGVVLLERSMPLAQRSADSITAELWEVRTGSIRTRRDGQWVRGEKLPAVVWENMPLSEEILQQELDRRDCAAHGITYQPPVKTKRDSLAHVMPMRG